MQTYLNPSYIYLRNGIVQSMKLYLLDYGAGNVQSLANSLTHLGYTFEWITSPEDFSKADVRTLSLLVYLISTARLNQHPR